MNNAKLSTLFRSARREPLPPLPAALASAVLHAITREPVAERPSLFDQLEALFPRLVWATALLIALCLLADFALSAAGQPDLASGAAQLSEQWLFATKGF